MKASERGRAFIKSFESCRLEAYPDPGTGGEPWTIGWGHTGSEVKPGLIWTQEQADQAFDDDLAQFEGAVNSLVKASLNQNQFDALVSFAFNVGPDIDADEMAEGLGDSTLLKKLNAGDYRGAAEEFPKWNKSGGKVMPGLVRRRAGERTMFLS